MSNPRSEESATVRNPDGTTTVTTTVANTITVRIEDAYGQVIETRTVFRRPRPENAESLRAANRSDCSDCDPAAIEVVDGQAIAFELSDCDDEWCYYGGPTTGIA